MCGALLFLPVVSAVAFAAECEDLEILLLFDVSSGFGPRKDYLAAEVATAIRTAETQSATLRSAVASFIDKPVPGVGYGDFGGYLSTGLADYCYDLASEFITGNGKSLESLVSNLVEGGGLDFYEGHWEALTDALVDPALEWSSGTKKTIVMVTDDLGHINLPGFSAAEKVDLFRQDVVCSDDGTTTTGGFGALTLPTGLVSWTPKENEYWEYANLLKQPLCDNTPLTDAQNQRLEELKIELKQVYVDALLPFDLDTLKQDPAAHCKLHEFPTYEQVEVLLRDLDVQLIVVLIDTWSALRKQSRDSGLPSLLNAESRADSTTPAAWEWILTDPLKNIKTALITILEGDLGVSGKLAGLLVEQFQGLTPAGCPTVPPTTVSTEFIEPDACLDVELLFLLDASSSFEVRREGLAKALQAVVAQLEGQFRNVRAGVATFVDKPIPEAGIGNFGGYLLANFQEDWCFDLASPLTDSASATLDTVISNLPQGGGLDPYDGHWEAMVNAMTNETVGWSTGATRKVVVMVTDQVGHVNVPTFAGSEGMERFRASITCGNATSTGGFGALEPVVDKLPFWTPLDLEYFEYAQLTNKTLCAQQSLTPEEQAHYDQLEAALALTKLDSLLPFDAQVLKTDPWTHCEKHEFPTYEQVVSLMEPKAVQFVVVLVDTETLDRAGRDAAREHRGRVQVQSRADLASTQEAWEWILSTPLANFSTSLITAAATQVENVLVDELLQSLQQLTPPQCVSETSP